MDAAMRDEAKGEWKPVDGRKVRLAHICALDQGGGEPWIAGAPVGRRKGERKAEKL